MSLQIMLCSVMAKMPVLYNINNLRFYTRIIVVDRMQY